MNDIIGNMYYFVLGAIFMLLFLVYASNKNDD